MKLLVDTHALLWFALGDTKMPQSARDLIADPDNRIWVSPASHWEIAIKISTGKYTLPIPFTDFFEQAMRGNGFQTLSILPEHTNVLTTMPFHHRDPFDRLMVAQAIAEGMDLVSADGVLDQYQVTRHW